MFVPLTLRYFDVKKKLVFVPNSSDSSYLIVHYQH